MMTERTKMIDHKIDRAEGFVIAWVFFAAASFLIALLFNLRDVLWFMFGVVLGTISIAMFLWNALLWLELNIKKEGR